MWRSRCSQNKRYRKQRACGHGLASFWLDIRIPDGTNTKDEKAAFIAAVFKRIGELLGPLRLASYVIVPWDDAINALRAPLLKLVLTR